MVKVQKLNTYIGKVAIVIYAATVIMVILALIIDMINFPVMLMNNIVALVIIITSILLYIFRSLKMSTSLGIVIYTVLFNIILGLFNISHGAYQVHFFLRNSLFIIYMMIMASLLSHKLNGIIITCIYLITFISFTVYTGDPFLKDTILIQLSLLTTFTAGVYYFINAFEKSIHDLGEKSEIILKQNELLNETNSLLKERQLHIETQSEELEVQKEVLTQQKEELTQINDELHEVVVTKDKFFSIIAHDLRNPLSTLIGFSEYLYKESDDCDEQKKNEIYKAIYDSSLNASNLLENLLIWSRMQMGGIKTHPENINLFNIVDSACKLHENARINKNIKLEVKVDETLEVISDKYMLISVVNNILSNAIKFTYMGGTIRISSELSDKNTVIVRISDNGMGIQEKNIARIFRIDTSYTTLGTNDEKGTGLGLLLCKEFIERNGGKIWVESEPGKGSDFYFTLEAIR
jgi:signal transduction histidine kinase